MWKIKLQKIVGNLLARLDELQIVHEWNGHLEIFSRVKKILGFVQPANKKQEHTLPADQPMAIWSGFVDYSRIYSALREGA